MMFIFMEADHGIVSLIFGGRWWSYEGGDHTCRWGRSQWEAEAHWRM